MSMLNCIHSKWLTATLLLLSARPLTAQHWNDDDIKKKYECPTGFQWTVLPEGFLSGTGLQNPYDAWRQTRGAPSSTDANDQTRLEGMPMPLKQGKGYNDTALESIFQWVHPVYATVQFSSTGAPGIPSTFNFRKSDRADLGEMDFVVASVKTDESSLKHFVSTPIWTPDGNGGLRKLTTLGSDPEVKIELAGGTTYATNISGQSKTFAGSGDKAEQASYFDQNWAITWDGFDPTKVVNRYGVAWHSDKIEWYAGNNLTAMPLRITLSTTKNIFPKGPLPITFGPWEAVGDWAGVTNWTADANPIMTTYRVDVYGCVNQTASRENNPERYRAEPK